MFGALLVICALLVAAFIPDAEPLLTGQLHHSSTSRRPSGKYAYQKCTLLTTIPNEKDFDDDDDDDEHDDAGGGFICCNIFFEFFFFNLAVFCFVEWNFFLSVFLHG